MRNEDRARFAQIMVALGDYYGAKTPDSMFDIYWNDFRDVDIAVFEKAVSDHRKDPDQGMFFPKVANIMRHIVGTAKDKQISQESKAKSIWSQFIEHLRSRGKNEPFRVENQAALQAFKSLGGMNQLGTIENSQIEWVGKDFAKAYLANIHLNDTEVNEVLLLGRPYTPPVARLSKSDTNTNAEGMKALKSLLSDLSGNEKKDDAAEIKHMTSEEVRERKKEIRSQYDQWLKNKGGKDAN